MNLLFIANSAALGVGLAMDAFSVSLANGLHEPYMNRKRICAIAGVYAFFQYIMPMIGWICVHTIVEVFSQFRQFIPWIALLLLLYIGGKMILEGIGERNADEEELAAQNRSASNKDLLIQGIATSIDALSVGRGADHRGSHLCDLRGRSSDRPEGRDETLLEGLDPGRLHIDRDRHRDLCKGSIRGVTGSLKIRDLRQVPH